jgi:hypothetical protein
LSENSVLKIVGIIGIIVILISFAGVTLNSGLNLFSKNEDPNEKLPINESSSEIQSYNHESQNNETNYSVPSSCRYDDPANLLVMDIRIALEFSSLNNYRLRVNLDGNPYTLLVKITNDESVLLSVTDGYFPNDTFSDFSYYPHDNWEINIETVDPDMRCQTFVVTWNPSYQPDNKLNLTYYHLEKGVFDVHGEKIVKVVPEMVSAVGVMTQLNWNIEFYSIYDGSLVWEFVLAVDDSGTFTIQKSI